MCSSDLGSEPIKKNRKPRSSSVAFNASKAIDDINNEFTRKLDGLKKALEDKKSDGVLDSLLSMPIPKLIQKAMDYQAKKASQTDSQD